MWNLTPDPRLQYEEKCPPAVLPKANLGSWQTQPRAELDVLWVAGCIEEAIAVLLAVLLYHTDPGHMKQVCQSRKFA